MTVTRLAKLFQAGAYPTKGITITSADLDKMVDTFDGSVPVKVEHIDSAFDGALGEVKQVFRRGDTLYGWTNFEKPAWDLIEKANARKLSVGIDRNTFKLRETSIVKNPQVKDAQIFSESTEAEYIYFASLIGDDPESIAAEFMHGGHEPTSIKGVADLLKALGGMDPPIMLPSDTDESNLVERLGAAILAINGVTKSTEDDLSEPPEDSEEKPGPVAMSKELEFAADLLAQSNTVNPKTGKPFTASEIVALSKEADQPVTIVKMSDEDQAAVNWARKQATANYLKRIEMCVTQSKVSPKVAKDLVDRLKETNIQFSFDSNGEPVPTEFDFILQGWESIPANQALTNQTPTSVKRSKSAVFGGQETFSIGGDTFSEEQPNEDDDANVPMTEEEADEVLKKQFANSGITPDRGGYAVVK